MRIKKFLTALALVTLGLSSPSLAQNTGVAGAQVSITPNASAYVSGYVIGGVQAIPNMVQPSGPGGTIALATSIVDTSATDASIDLFVFNAAPTGTYTDHSTFTIASADIPKLVGVIFGANSTCAKDGATQTGICEQISALPVTTTTPVTSSYIWIIPVIRATPTYGSGITLYLNVNALP